MAAGGKNKKYGRMTAACKQYKSEGRREKNRKRRVRRHIRNYPNDAQAVTILVSL